MRIPTIRLPDFKENFRYVSDLVYTLTKILTDIATQVNRNSDVAADGSCFSAYQSAVQAIPATTYTTLLFDVATLDVLGEYNPATGVLTVINPGVYFFTGRVHGTQGAATTRAIALFVNGVQVTRMQHNVADPGSSVIAGDSGLVSLNAGDAVTMRYYTGIAENTTPGSNVTDLSGWRVR